MYNTDDSLALRFGPQNKFVLIMPVSVAAAAELEITPQANALAAQIGEQLHKQIYFDWARPDGKEKTETR